MADRFRSFAVAAAPSFLAAALAAILIPGTIGLDLLCHICSALLLLGAAALVVGRAGVVLLALPAAAQLAGLAAAWVTPQFGLGAGIAVAVFAGSIATALAGLAAERVASLPAAIVSLVLCVVFAFLLPSGALDANVAVPRNLWIAPVLATAGLLLARRLEQTAGGAAAALAAIPSLQPALGIDRTRLLLPVLAVAGMLVGTAGFLELFDVALSARDAAVRAAVTASGVAVAVWASSARDLAGTLAWGLPIVIVPMAVAAVRSDLALLPAVGLLFGAIIVVIRRRLQLLGSGHA